MKKTALFLVLSALFIYQSYGDEDRKPNTVNQAHAMFLMMIAESDYGGRFPFSKLKKDMLGHGFKAIDPKMFNGGGNKAEWMIAGKFNGQTIIVAGGKKGLSFVIRKGFDLKKYITHLKGGFGVHEIDSVKEFGIKKTSLLLKSNGKNHSCLFVDVDGINKDGFAMIGYTPYKLAFPNSK